MGNRSKTRQYKHKPDFPKKLGAGRLCPLGDCLDNSWACSVQRGPYTVLASAFGEPAGAGPSASRPSLLPSLPSDVYFQSPPCTKADVCSATCRAEIRPQSLRGFEATEESSQPTSTPWPQKGEMSPLTPFTFSPGSTAQFLNCSLG